MASATLSRLEALWKSILANTYGGKVDAGANRYLAAGDKYLSSAAPSGAGVLAEWQALLVLDVAATTVALQTDGTIKITWGSGSHSYTWASTAFRNALGFTADLGAATSHTSTKRATCLWLPNNYLSGQRGSINSLGAREEDTIVTRAQAGGIWRTNYNRYTAQRFEWQSIAKALVWTEEETAPLNGSFESFWTNWLSPEGTFRHYTDATSATSYLTPIAAASRDYVFDHWEDPERVRANSDALWRVRFNARLLV